MVSKNDSLYGTRKKSDTSKMDTTSSTTLAFTSHLSSLISKELGQSSTADSSPVSRGRTRPHKTKEDIFLTHNKNTQKRAAADLAADDDEGRVFQKHKTATDIGHVDEAMLKRSKARMQEKARLYAELKKGEHLAESSDEEDNAVHGDHAHRSKERARLERMRKLDSNSLVDFDRKWAEEERKKARAEAGAESQEEEDEQEPLVEYTDEFGRTRMGTRAEAAEAQRAASTGVPSGVPLVNTPTEARPARPSKIIHGPTIQTSAFNPDESIAKQMAELAAKRDRTPTPPPETHYDAEHEIRTRGTGFYAFSKDEETRKKEMEELKKAREDTLTEREQGRDKKRKRDEAKEERRKKIEELRSKRRAEEFLNGLGGEIGKTEE
ncbi:GTP-binding protein [Ascosphaera pollenicola]|nr:GTP-binding protein [Ascosphaera pollenicola]